MGLVGQQVGDGQAAVGLVGGSWRWTGRLWLVCKRLEMDR